jgi:hypothetical protein
MQKRAMQAVGPEVIERECRATCLSQCVGACVQKNQMRAVGPEVIERECQATCREPAR